MQSRQDASTGGYLLKDLIFTFFAFRRAIFWISGVILSGFVAIALLSPPVWQADGAFLIKGKRSERDAQTLEDTMLRVEPVTKEDLYSEVQMLVSDDVVRNTVQRLLAEKRIALKEQSGEPGAGRGDPVEGMAKTVGASLETAILPTSNVIEVALRWHDPKEAKNILEALMEEYRQFRHRILNPGAKEVFLADQVNSYLSDWKGKQDDLMHMVGDLKAPNPDQEIQNNLLLRKDYSQLVQGLDSQAIIIANEIQAIRAGLGGEKTQLFSYIQTETVRNLSTNLQTLLLRQVEIDKTYLPDSPVAVGIAKQVAKSRELLYGEVESVVAKRESDLAAVQTQIEGLKSKIAQLDERNIVLKRFLLTSERINRESGLLAYSFETFYKRRDESNLQGGSKGFDSHVVVLRKAKVQPAPVAPNRPKLIAIGLVFGFFFALSVMAIYNQIDQTFKQPSDISHFLGLPIIISVPEMETDRPKRGNRSGSAGKPSPFQSKKALFAGLVVLGGIVVVSLLPGNPDGPGKMTFSLPDRLTRGQDSGASVQTANPLPKAPENKVDVNRTLPTTDFQAPIDEVLTEVMQAQKEVADEAKSIPNGKLAPDTHPKRDTKPVSNSRLTPDTDPKRDTRPTSNGRLTQETMPVTDEKPIARFSVATNPVPETRPATNLMSANGMPDPALAGGVPGKSSTKPANTDETQRFPSQVASVILPPVTESLNLTRSGQDSPYIAQRKAATQALLSKSGRGRYLVHLMAIDLQAARAGKLEELLANHKNILDRNQLFMYENTGKNLLMILVGEFDNMDAGLAFLHRLPASLKKGHPYLRRAGELRQALRVTG
ncbi:MAG: hypothetical protein H7833_02440 [Magnetococcus sp. DMHC-1]|nr:hypothetical protein [Magnetococcales bacterium]